MDKLITNMKIYQDFNRVLVLKWQKCLFPRPLHFKGFVIKWESATVIKVVYESKSDTTLTVSWLKEDQYIFPLIKRNKVRQYSGYKTQTDNHATFCITSTEKLLNSQDPVYFKNAINKF